MDVLEVCQADKQSGRSRLPVFEFKDVIRLLRSEVERAGGQSAWARKAGVDRSVVNRILFCQRLPSKAIIRALKLRTVFVSEPELFFATEPELVFVSEPKPSHATRVWNWFQIKNSARLARLSVFELKDVIRLLRSEVERAGGQSAWARKAGVDLSVVQKILIGQRLPSKTIIRALKLRRVFVFEPELFFLSEPGAKQRIPGSRAIA